MARVWDLKDINQITEVHPYIDAIIFGLDVVITDSADFHFQSWKHLADEEGIPFSLSDNVKLGGASRRKSLEFLLGDRQVTEFQAEEMIARKNRYYEQLLSSITKDDLLPGVRKLLVELERKEVKIAITSASHNAPLVLDRLGIRDKIDILVDGSSVTHHKPTPDFFLYAAHQLGVPPCRCLVVEDTASGIEAAHSAGMVALGLGLGERIAAADLVLPDLENVTFGDLSYAATWRVSEPEFVPARQHYRETIFTQGNGYIGTRGTLEERYPFDQQATFVHGFWDDAPIFFTELANVPDWTALEIRVNGHRFRLDQGSITNYSRFLDLRTGVLHRRLRWTHLEHDFAVDLHFLRFPSLAEPHVMVLRVNITPVDFPAQVDVRVMLDSHVENQGLLHLHTLSQYSDEHQAGLLVKTRYTGKLLAMSTRLQVHGGSYDSMGQDCPGCPGINVTARLDANQTLTIDKVVAVYTSGEVEDPLMHARLKAEEAAQAGFQSLSEANDVAWVDFWETSDVIIEGDDEAQLSLRHALYQLRIAAPTTDEHVSIGAKTLSGFGYHGHVFWDNEIFVLPFFTYTQPSLARNMLMYRLHTLPGARKNAIENGFNGAQYAWESAETGEEVTPTWVPHFQDRTKLFRIWTGDLEIHISADIAYAMHQFWQVTGDDDFWRDVGIPILLETAVFWGERAEQEGDRFAIRDVIGPDEYHDHVDNNAFTNRMVQYHLETALDALDWLADHAPECASTLKNRLDLTPARLAHWRRIIDGLIILQDSETGLIEQFEGFFNLKDADWPTYSGRTKSMQGLLGTEGANEYQVLKQADVLMLLCLLGNQFDQQTLQVNWDYYNPRTDHSHGSSLSPSIHAWIACELGQPEVAYEHFMRAARADLGDIRGNARDGIHAASAGGLWQAVVFGFAGLKLEDMDYSFRPCLPAHWTRLAFRFTYRGVEHEVDLGVAQSEVIDRSPM